MCYKFFNFGSKVFHLFRSTAVALLAGCLAELCGSYCNHMLSFQSTMSLVHTYLLKSSHIRRSREKTFFPIKRLCLAFLLGKGNGTPLQYSCLENPMDGGAWWAAVHGVMKSRTQLSDFTLTFSLSCTGEEMATHSSVPGESQGRGSLVGCHLWGRTESDTTEGT